jgi:hypothetical protein
MAERTDAYGSIVLEEGTADPDDSFLVSWEGVTVWNLSPMTDDSIDVEEIAL